MFANKAIAYETIILNASKVTGDHKISRWYQASIP